MILDFKVCGGFLMVVIGFRMINVKMFLVVDMILVMIVIMLLSWMWMNWIMLLL